MFELEEYSTGGFHEGYLSKYPESSGPTLDFYITDSLQDMLDVDIRSEIANVVGSSNELASLVSDLPSSLDHAIDAMSSFNNIASASSTCSNNHSYLHSSAWLSATSGPTWSSSNDFYADVGACVNPISVMPMISSSLLLRSPKTNLNINGLSSASSPPPPSPTENKSHLTFSPAHIKNSTNAMRNKKSASTTTSIPKKVVAISSAVTNATTAPATMATNSTLQRRNIAIDAIKKDLATEMSKSTKSRLISGTTTAAITGRIKQENSASAMSATNTIKLAPGIGGLTFANSVTYNKLKKQSGTKSANGSPVTTNGTIVLKRDRDSSPLHHMATLNTPNTSNNNATVVNGFINGQQVTKVLARTIAQINGNYTPKSIASAQSPLMQNPNSSGIGNGSGSFSVGSPSSSSNGSSSFAAGRLTPIIVNGRLTPNCSGGSTHSNATTTITAGRLTPIIVKSHKHKYQRNAHEREFPKPAYSYSCLIAMALKNSRGGCLPVSEIYSFMCEHFPYFKTAPGGWKNSVRHNLSLNKCFEKIEKPATNGNQRKGCLWAMNPERIIKMDEEIQKWSRKDPLAIRKAMVYPDNLDALERGEMKHGSTSDSDLDLDSQSEIEETSDSEEHELVDDAIVDTMFVEEDIEEVVEDEVTMLGSSQHHMSVVSDGSDVVGAGSDEEVSGAITGQQQSDFDIEVEDIYDAIDMEDDKEAVRMAISQSSIIEMGTADVTPAQNVTSVGYQSPKRARLNANYSIRLTGELEKQYDQQQATQQQHQSLVATATFKQIKLQGQQPQQHILVQAKRGNSPQQELQKLPQFQHFNTPPNHNRRKMQLVNRIA